MDNSRPHCAHDGCPHPALYRVISRGVCVASCGQHLNQMMLAFHVPAGYSVTVQNIDQDGGRVSTLTGGLFHDGFRL